LDDEGAGVKLELLADEFRVGRRRCISLSNVLAEGYLVSFPVNGPIVFVPFVLLLLKLLPAHHGQKLKENPLKLLNRIEEFDASASVQAGRFQQPKIAILTVVTTAVERLAEHVDFLLDIWVLPSHKVLHFGDKGERPALLGCFPGIVFKEEVKKLLEVVLTILVVKI
jgi:hypothetical protein